MTAMQSNWASQHDWFRWAERDGLFKFSVYVYDSSTEDLLKFSDYHKLRHWAGY